MAKGGQKIILVTGATSGIGRAIALLFGMKGNTIIAVGRNRKALSLLERNISAQGGTIHTYTVDLSNPEETVELCKKLKNKFKIIHWVVYSAGTIDAGESTERLGEQVLRETFEVNLFSILRMTPLLLPLVKEGGFIHISSTAGVWGNGRKPIYSASKGALIAYGKSLAWYLKDEKELSSIVICPGPTNTPMRERIAGDAGKHQSPAVIADLIKRITDGKSRYKNGDVLIINNNKISLESRLPD